MTRTRRATWLPGSGGPAGVAAPVIGADYLRCRANNRQPQRGHLCAYTMTGARRTERIAPTGPRLNAVRPPGRHAPVRKATGICSRAAFNVSYGPMNDK